jgi:hypothetical protein
MKPGRILAAAGALSLVALGAGTMVAHAANNISVQFDAPAPNFEFTSPSTDLRGHYSVPNGTTISDLTVTVKTPDGQTVSQPFSPSCPPCSFEWVPPAWARNGAYTATAVANGQTNDIFNPQPVSGTASVSFYVSAPPQTPSGVKTSADDSARSVTVSWNANPEPDLVMYVIGRYYGTSSSAKAFFVDPSQTSFLDKLGSSPAGSYRYDVYAVRSAAKSSEKPIPSNSAGTSTASVRSAPSTTNTTTGGSGGNTSTTVSPSGSGSSSSSSSSSSSGSALAQKGKVDLSGFGNLLAQSGGLPARSASPPGTLEPDPGFDQTLPYGSRPPAQSGSDNNNTAALGAPDSQRLTSSKERPTSLLFLAAGLLATVLLMHLLWVKSEVDRTPLDPLPAPTPRPQPKTRRREPRLP